MTHGRLLPGVRSITAAVRNFCDKVIRYSSFPILVGKFFISLQTETFFSPTGFQSKVYIQNSAYLILILRSNCIKQISWTCIVTQLWHHQAIKYAYCRIFVCFYWHKSCINCSENARVIVENKVAHGAQPKQPNLVNTSWFNSLELTRAYE